MTARAIPALVPVESPLAAGTVVDVGDGVEPGLGVVVNTGKVTLFGSRVLGKVRRPRQELERTFGFQVVLPIDNMQNAIRNCIVS
jgi:hypothetical protein